VLIGNVQINFGVIWHLVLSLSLFILKREMNQCIFDWPGTSLAG